MIDDQDRAFDTEAQRLDKICDEYRAHDRQLPADEQLDDLGWEIFRIAVMLDMRPAAAARLAMDGNLRQRKRVSDDLIARLVHRENDRASRTPDAGTAIDQLRFWEQRTTPDGFVYFIQSGGDQGLVKIGRAASPLGRVRQLQTGSAVDLHLRHVVPGGQQLETALHHRFAPARVRGEWFGAEYLPVILAYAAGIAHDAIHADDGSGIAPWVTDTGARSQQEAAAIRGDIERMFLRGIALDVIQRATGLSDHEYAAHLATMHASTAYTLTRPPTGFRATRDEAMRERTPA